MVPAALSALAAVLLAVYAGFQHRRDEDRKRREEAPHLVAVGQAEPVDKVLVVNMSAHPVWLTSVKLTRWRDELPLALGAAPRTLGQRPLLQPGDWIELEPGRVDDAAGPEDMRHREDPWNSSYLMEYDTMLEVTFHYSRTSQALHTWQWRVERVPESLTLALNSKRQRLAATMTRENWIADARREWESRR